MDELQKLYNSLLRDGYYTKSFEEFQIQYEDPTYRDKVFGVVSRDGLYTKSREEFDVKYSTLKKKDQAVQDDMGLPSEDGSLDLQKIEDVIAGKPQEIAPTDTRLPRYVDPLSSAGMGMYPDEATLEVATQQSEADKKYTESLEQRGRDREVNGASIDASKALLEVYPDGVDPKLITIEDGKYVIPSVMPNEEGEFVDYGIGIEEGETELALEKQKIAVERAKELGVISFFDKDVVARDKFLQADFRQLGIQTEDEYEGTLFEEKGEGFDPFERVLSQVNAELIDSEEEYVVPKLNYLLSEYGFTFEETGAGDNVKVTASNKEQTVVDLDTWYSFGEEAGARRLKGFLLKNKLDTSALNKMTDNRMRVLDEKEIIETVKVFNNETEAFRNEKNSFAEEYTQFAEMFAPLEALSRETLANNPELKAQYDSALQKQKELMSKYEVVTKREDYFKSRAASLDKMAGEYYEMRGEQGEWMPAIWNKFAAGAANYAKTAARTVMSLGYEGSVGVAEQAVLLRGNASEYGIEIPEGLSDEEVIEFVKDADAVTTTVDVPGTSGPDGFEPGGTRTVTRNPTYEKILASDKDQFLKETLYGGNRYRNPYSTTAFSTDTEMGMVDAIDTGVRELLTTGNTTEQWENLQSEGFLGGAVLGLAESIPAMLGGAGPIGWAQRTAQMYSLSTEHVMDEMEENAEFDNISETEKFFVTAPIGIAVGVLEAIGLRNIMSSNPLVLNLVRKALGKSTAKTTAKTFGEFIRQDVNSLLGRGALIIGAGGIAEFETGFAQEIAETTIKDIYNNSKDKDMFQTPDTWTEFFLDALRAGGQEMIGGFIMGTIPAAASMAAGNTLTELSDEKWAMFKEISNDPNYKKMYMADLKRKVSAGEMTTKQAKEAEEELNELLGMLPQINNKNIPVDLDVSQQKEVVQLLLEQQKLESKNEGLRPVLRKRNDSRITAIDSRIEEIIEQNAQTQQAERVAEEGITEFTEEGDVSSKTRSEEVTEEEAGDIEEFFGEENDTTEKVGDNLSLNKKGTSKFTPSQKRVKDRVMIAARMGAKAISKVLPDVRIVLHESNDEFLRFTGRDGKAEYIPEEKVIHVNLSSATLSSVPHEIFHAVFIEKVKTDEAAGKAAEAMIMSVRKTLKDDSALAKRIDDFAATYVGKQAEFQNEERLAELVGILSSEYRSLSKPAKSKVVEFFRSIARQFGIELESDFGKTDESVIDLLNTIARKTRKGEVIEESDIAFLEQIPYSEGEVVTPTETTGKPQPRQDKNVFKGIDFVESIPIVSMKEFVKSVAGKLFAVTSDATKVGYDNNGERVDGGFGYTAFKENLAGKIGFASLDMEVAKKTMAKIAKNFKAGDVIGVLIMVQNPSATIGNYYGGKYLGRALKQLQEADGDAYQLMVDEVAILLQTNEAIGEALKKKQTEQKLIDLLRDPSKFTENEFAKEWISDTTFDVRREMLKAMIISSPETRTTKATPIYKTMLKDAGFNLQDFLMEYGDVKLIGENNLKEDNGGFLVGGFKMTVPKPSAVNSLMTEVETQGFTHPQFNGKLPSTGEHFLFDGLYPIQENLQDFAVPETRIGKEFQEEADARVRKLAKKKGVGVFLKKFTDKTSDKYVPIFKRGYKNLSSTAKIIFKSQNEELLVESTPQLASGVARGMGLKMKEDVPASTEFSTAARQQKSMNQIIEEARQDNFPDATIRDYLVRVRNMKARVVDAALEVSRDAFEILPDAFKNMIGGVKAGEKLYKKVEAFRKKLERRNARTTYKNDAEIKAMVVAFAERLRTYDTNAQIQEMVDKYKARIERSNKRRRRPRSSAETKAMVAEFRRNLIATRDAKRAEVQDKITQFEATERRKNNRRVKPLTEQEIMTAMIEFMESQPEFKKEGDTFVEKGVTKFRKGLSTQQAQLISALQKNVGIRPTQDMAAKVRRARFAVRERLKGQRDIQSIKRAMRNFMRQALPADLYTKKEVLDLLRQIETVNRDNIENLQGELEEFVITKNVARLKRNIDNILNAAYETLQSGRRKGVKIDLATREQIEKIRDSILPEETEAEKINEANEKLQRRWNELDKKPDATVAEQMEMVTAQMIIEYNNSLLMENSDVNKVATLDIVETTLSEMIQFGRSALQAELYEAKLEYDRQFEVAYKEVTGNEIDMSEENAKEQLEEQKRERANQSSKKSVASKIKVLARNIATGIDGVFTSAEGLDGLMDKISTMAGEMFGGPLQDLVTGKIDEASRTFKARRMYTEFAVKNKLEELYGKNWQKKARENRVGKTEISLNKAKLQEAQDAYNANPTRENKIALENVVDTTTRMYSQNQMYYLYNQYKDAANHGAFEKMFGSNYEEVMEEITSKIDPEVKEFADWQVTEFFPELYERYNDVYKRVYRTNMPWNENYAGRIYRDGVVPEPLDLLSDNNAFNNSVNGASTRARLENVTKIQEMDGTDALMSYVNDMEYFAAYAEAIRDVNKLFTNEFIRDSIIKTHGQPTMNLINNMIGKIANKGTRTEMMASFINGLNNVFIISRLGLSPVIMIKQLTSTFTYANDIGVGNWLKYSAKSIPQLKDTWTEIRENSVYMQDRKYDGIMKAIESYNENAMQEFVPMPTKDFFVNVAMYMVKFGDRSAIFLGGTPNYLFYKDQAMKQGKTEEEAIEIAIRKFERDTKRTQQSSDLQDKDVFQTSNPVVRALNMFLTTPKQYLRKEIQAVRSLNRKLMAWDRDAGKGTVTENVRTLMMYHVFMPVLFQYVSMGLPGMLRGWRDDDDEDLIRAAAIGNLNGLFIIGEVFAALGDYFTGKPWAGESTKSIGVINIVSGIIQRFKRADKLKDKKKKAEAYKKAYMELITISGIPAPTLAKLHKNYEAIINGETDDAGELILRLLNFSDYQIDGPSKDEKKYKTIDEMNTEYDRIKRREEREEKSRQRLLEQGLDAIPLEGGLGGSGLESESL